MNKKLKIRYLSVFPKLLAAVALGSTSICALAGILPTPDHVVVVVEENKAFEQIIGNSGASYINTLAQHGAVMTDAHGTEGVSQPNYLQLFSGSNQGVADNTIPPEPFDTPNLRSALDAQGLAFTAYSDSLPYAGFTGTSYTSVPGQNQYVRKHNPWVNWLGASSNAVSTTEVQPFTSFPTTDFSALPTVSFVVPNEQHNMHDGSIAAGDTWLEQNIGDYVTWAQTHNSLLILTWDEDDGNHGNHIATLLVGPMVIPGLYSQPINHLHVLRTVEDMYGLDYVGNTPGVSAIDHTFAVPEPPSLVLLMTGVFAPLLLGRATRPRRRPLQMPPAQAVRPTTACQTRCTVDPAAECWRCWASILMETFRPLPHQSPVVGIGIRCIRTAA